MKAANCSLCKAERKTKWYYEDDKVWVADCETCRIPMIVWRDHVMKLKFEDVEHMLWVVLMLFGDGVTIRFKQRKIHDHLHWHIEGVK